MQCMNVRKRLNAWVDNELEAREAARIGRHLEQCPGCRLEVDAIRQVAVSLDALPALSAPPALSRMTLRAFRANLETAGMAQWWKGLSLAMRGVLCGAALAGLLCGAALGTSISALGTDSLTNPYQTLYASTDKGFLP